MILVWLAKVLAVFNANIRPGEVAAGIALGLLAALVPAGNLVWLALLLLVFFVKVNQAIFFVSMAVFKLLAGFLDPALDAVGWEVLRYPALQDAFVTMANTPIVPWTRFNDTLVMGGFVVGLLALLPTWFLFRWLIKVWRSSILPKMMASAWYKAFLRFPLIRSLANLAGRILKLSREFV